MTYETPQTLVEPAEPEQPTEVIEIYDSDEEFPPVKRSKYAELQAQVNASIVSVEMQKAREARWSEMGRVGRSAVFEDPTHSLLNLILEHTIPDNDTSHYDAAFGVMIYDHRKSNRCYCVWTSQWGAWPASWLRPLFMLNTNWTNYFRNCAPCFSIARRCLVNSKIHENIARDFVCIKGTGNYNHPNFKTIASDLHNLMLYERRLWFNHRVLEKTKHRFGSDCTVISGRISDNSGGSTRPTFDYLVKNHPFYFRVSYFVTHYRVDPLEKKDLFEYCDPNRVHVPYF